MVAVVPEQQPSAAPARGDRPERAGATTATDEVRPGADPARPTADPALRDALTADWLREAAGPPVPDLQVLRLTPRWWDGAAFVPCLLVRWRRTTWRLVAFDGAEVLALPRGQRRARRLLARYRAEIAPRHPAPLAGLRVLRGRRPLVALPPTYRDAVEMVAATEPRAVRAQAQRERARAVASLGVLDDPAQPALFGVELLAAALAEPELPRPRGRHRARRLVQVQAVGDGTVCRNQSCGGVLLLPAPGAGEPDERCPRCGRR